jgi:hypothetical protein
MRLFKATTIALALGMGMALASTHAFSQSSYTATTGSDGISQSDVIEGGYSSLQATQTSTQGTGISAAIATPDLAASGGASLAGFQGASLSGSNQSSSNYSHSSDTNSSSAGGKSIQAGGFSASSGGQNSDSGKDSESSGGSSIQAGGFSASSGGHSSDSVQSDTTASRSDTSSFSACFFCSDNGSSQTEALSAQSGWIAASHGSFVGSTSTSSTGSSGPSVAALFVFGQSTDIPESGELKDKTVASPLTYISNSALNNESGTVALNQVAGVGNEQGNNLGTVTQMTGQNSTTAGSNSFNLQSNQTIADAGEIEGSARQAGCNQAGETAYISNAMEYMSGNAMVNQASGVANQQLNNVILAH